MKLIRSPRQIPGLTFHGISPKLGNKFNDRPMPSHTACSFAHEKHQMGLLIRTIGFKRAEAKISLVNLT